MDISITPRKAATFGYGLAQTEIGPVRYLAMASDTIDGLALAGSYASGPGCGRPRNNSASLRDPEPPQSQALPCDLRMILWINVTRSE